MKNIGLGQIIETEQQRDAIHVAVAPVVAGEKLSPGDHVGFMPDGRVGEVAMLLIGVVDPFLRRTVKPGEKFWLIMYPNTITGLRHEWTHPAFEVAQNISASEQWLRNFAVTSDNLSYETLMSAAHDYVERGEYLCQGGRFEGMGVPDEFWTHYETVTGRKVETSDRGSFFSCSC